ncbi:hypothetical protein RCL1_008319 [Eukaryota sp. TZLM3-RCL]
MYVGDATPTACIHDSPGIGSAVCCTTIDFPDDPQSSSVVPFSPQFTLSYTNVKRSYDGVRSFCFYSFFVLIFIFFWLLVPRSVVEQMSEVFCPPNAILESSSITLSSNLPTYNLHLTGQNRRFLQTIYFEKTHSNVPHVILSWSNSHFSADSSLDFTLELVSTSIDSFTFIIHVESSVSLLSIKIDWLVISVKCIPQNSVDSFHSRLIQSIKNDSESMIHSVSSSLNHDSLTSDFLTLSSLTAFKFPLISNSFNLFSEFSTVNDSLYLTHQLITNQIDRFAYSFLSLDPNYLSNLNLKYLMLNFSESEYPNFDLATSNHLRRDFVEYISFDSPFLRTPYVHCLINGLNFNSLPKFNVKILNVTFTGFSIHVEAFPGCSISEINLSFLIVDELPFNFDVFDIFLYSILSILIVTALLFEFCTPYTSPLPLFNDEFPSVMSSPRVMTSSLRGTQHSRQYPHPEVLESWKRMVSNYHKIRNTNTKRHPIEVFVITSLSALFLFLLFLFFRDVVLEHRLFHQLNSLIVTIFVLGLEYGLLIAALLFVRWPDKVATPRTARHDVAVLIACHCSAGVEPTVALKRTKKNVFQRLSHEEQLQLLDKLRLLQSEKQSTFERTLIQAWEAVGDGNVFICHNSNDKNPNPQDPMFEVIRRLKSLGKDIRYCYVPKGNKTVALKYCAKNFLPDYIKYVCVMDDDILIPSNFHWPIEMLESQPDAAGVALTIRADETNSFANKKRGLRMTSVWFADLEYLLAGFSKLFQVIFGTTNAPHGAISLWKKESLNTVFQYQFVYFYLDLFISVIQLYVFFNFLTTFSW